MIMRQNRRQETKKDINLLGSALFHCLPTTRVFCSNFYKPNQYPVKAGDEGPNKLSLTLTSSEKGTIFIMVKRIVPSISD